MKYYISRKLPGLVRRELIPEDLRANSPQREQSDALQIHRDAKRANSPQPEAANSPPGGLPARPYDRLATLSHCSAAF